MSEFENPIILIPARLDSQRLPGKCLMDIQGIPMIIRVAKKCVSAVGHNNVLVTTPDKEIAQVCSNFGISYIYSSQACLSGTDRLSEFIKNNKNDLVVNVQGDEPMIPISTIQSFYKYVQLRRETCVGVSPIFDENYAKSRSVVKVAISGDRMVYVSRLPIESSDAEKNRIWYKHTGLYSYTRTDLELFGSTRPGGLEILENIEILRLIERGIEVKVVEVPNYGRAVDTLEDYVFVNQYGSFENN